MVFFNEAEYAAASNVHDCGIITFHNHDEYTHTHTPARYYVCDWHTYSHVQSQKASTHMCARLSFTHHFLSSLSLTHTHPQKLIPLITDLHNRQHNSTGGPPQALFPSPPTQPESEEWEKQKKKQNKKKTKTVVLTCENIMEVGLEVKTEDYKVNPGSATQLERFYFCMHALDAGPYCGLCSHPGKAQSNVGNVAS